MFLKNKAPKIKDKKRLTYIFKKNNINGTDYLFVYIFIKNLKKMLA